MKRFHVEIDAAIDAENLDECFAALGKYYAALAETGDVGSPFVWGVAEIHPLDDEGLDDANRYLEAK